jgi:hypothetical protein
VAGPVYEKSIIKNLNIMQLPAKELILEVVYTNENDYDITLDEVGYKTLFGNKNKDKNSERLLGNYDNCHTCTDGVVDHVENTLDCGWLDGLDHEIFTLNNHKDINNYQYDASRASCVIMVPDCADGPNYHGDNGTLLHWPYVSNDNCNNQDVCGLGFVFTVWHVASIYHILEAYKSQNIDYLNNVLIRFNWHYKYGTPWNLENMDCGIDTNFAKWRSTIDFDEVVDYCGVRVFAYDSLPDDIAILKMVQKPFYKELHLGWTAQANFDVIYNPEGDTYSNNNDRMFNKDQFKIIGRRADGPTFLLTNYNTYMQNYDYAHPNYHELIMHYADTAYSDIIPRYLSGYSGAQLTFNDYDNPDQRIGLGLLYGGVIDTSSTGFRKRSYLYSKLYYLLFYTGTSYRFVDACYNSGIGKKVRMDSFYLNQVNISSQLKIWKFNHKYIPSSDTLTYLDSCKWYPSVNNKQNCPSQNFVADTCKFNINNYITWNDTTKCITIGSIPANLFPGGELPKGYRIYYNYGDQKTLYFDQYIDNQSIELNYSHCYTSCELFELYMQGIDSLNIAIDFYDGAGRILNNIGCEDIEFKAAISFDLCSMFEITALKTQSDSGCCIYTFTVTVKDSCAKNKPFIHKIAKTLKLLNSPNDTGISLSTIPGVTYNYSDGKITFNRRLCDSNSNDRFIFAYEDGNIICNPPEINSLSCSCACPDPDISKDWIDVITTPGGIGESCPEGFCNITYNINIPPFYNCFRFFKMGTSNRAIINGKASYSFCIPAGTVRTDTIFIKKSLSDTTPCRIIKNSYCPIQSEPKFCKSGCDSVAWENRTVDSIPLPGCPNCYIKGKYMTRTNTCEDKQELQVTEIEVYNTMGNSLACTPCSGNMGELHKKIILKAIYDNRMGFKPILNEENPDSLCDETWRVSIASCWSEYHSSFDLFNGDLNQNPKTRYVPCDTVCCSIGLRVCRYNGPPQHITIDTLQGDIDPNLCITDSLWIYDPYRGGFGGGNHQIDPNDGGSTAQVAGYKVPCINRCDLLDLLTSGAYYGKRALPYEPANNILVSNECRLLTYLTEETMNCIFESDVNSNNFSISIFSINGELLLKEKISVVKGNNEFTINLKNINSGIYLIQAELNGICSKTDKLIIVK